MKKNENIINYITSNENRIEWHRLCTMPNGNCKLGILHEISATTRKHISKFAREFAPKIGYQGFKNILEKDDGYKVLTDNSVYLSILAQMQAYKKGNATWKNPTLN